MDPATLAFMLGSWLFIVILAIYSISKLMKKKK